MIESSALPSDQFFQPQGYLEYINTLPFLGRLSSSTHTIEAGSWQEILLDYEVGASGIADGAWLKVTFKFYSDWGLFQTDDPTAPNYLSAEYQARPVLPGESPATVQSLKVRFDQKGHERPFQKAIIVDIIDGYLKPGDHILIRLGDRRGGSAGTRLQTFVEQDFRFRAYIDPVGTSRFAEIPGDVVLNIVPGDPANLVVLTPRLVQFGVQFPVRIRIEDRWGNVCWNLGGTIQLLIQTGQEIQQRTLDLSKNGWAIAQTTLEINALGNTSVCAEFKHSNLRSQWIPITIANHFDYPRAFFADLHVHSNHTVGTNSTDYNFKYGREAAGLDVLGYTANDFNITKERWEADVNLAHAVTQEGQFICYPGVEWCGNSTVGGDRNVIFLGDEILFPHDRAGNPVRSFEWNEEMKGKELAPGAWTLDKLYAAYADQADDHLLTPHVGGRRAILDWHHPRLERLVEVCSSWGHFPWFYQDAIQRGYRVGVAGSGDEHRGRCGGGAPGAAVFGTRGGLTGILSPTLTKSAISRALRSRHTWATTGDRLVALLWTDDHIQGDEFTSSKSVTVYYRLLGTAGWDEITAYTDSGLLWQRNLQAEAGYSANTIRLRWGGARIKDRYRSAEWRGVLSYSNTLVQRYQPYGLDHPEEFVRRSGSLALEFRSDTYGDADAIALELSDLANARFRLQIQIDGYRKGGSPLQRNPYVHCPEFEWEFTGKEILNQGILRKDLGGAELFVAIERISANPMPQDISDHFTLEPRSSPYGFVPVYITGRQIDDSKVWTSPLFIQFEGV